jgi:type IX secretion system PorP/SprF family membrane protein
MHTRYTIFILFFILTIAVKTSAQTPYSSQNFSATNFFNPASVGFGVNQQFQTFYRNQFAGVGEPYKTIGIGIDFALFKTEENQGNNSFGMGIQGVSEQVLNGVLQTNSITVSIANRVFLNENKTKFLSVGLSSSFITRTIDASMLTFGDQYYSGRLFNASSLESINKYPTKYSTNAGLMYSSVSPNSFFQLGASTFYINRSSNTQAYEKVNQSFQTLGLLNFEHVFNENQTFLIHADYQNRLETEFFFAGAALGLPLYMENDQVNRMYIGCFYRSHDAVVPYFGLLYNKYKIGLTYDVYQNNMTSSNLRPQTFEFTLSTYLGRHLSENLKSLFN